MTQVSKRETPRFQVFLILLATVAGSKALFHLISAQYVSAGISAAFCAWSVFVLLNAGVPGGEPWKARAYRVILIALTLLIAAEVWLTLA
jgi:hypothetical protein